MNLTTKLLISALQVRQFTNNIVSWKDQSFIFTPSSQDWAAVEGMGIVVKDKLDLTPKGKAFQVLPNTKFLPSNTVESIAKDAILQLALRVQNGYILDPSLYDAVESLSQAINDLDAKLKNEKVGETIEDNVVMQNTIEIPETPTFTTEVEEAEPPAEVPPSKFKKRKTKEVNKQ